MGNWSDIPTDALAHALSYCNASTLLRASMASSELRCAAVHEAKLRCADLHQTDEEEGAPRWEQTTQQPLARVFRAELTHMLERVREGWVTDAAFVWFRLSEADLCDARDEEKAVLVHTGSSPEWLHECADCDQFYDDTDAVEIGNLGLRVHETLWRNDLLRSNEAYLAYTRHIPLHRRYGRAVASAERELYRRLFDVAGLFGEPVFDPFDGPLTHAMKHCAIGDGRAIWFRCSLAFFDAIETRAR